MDRALPILCENCGYEIDSLAARLGAEPDIKCPECAKPITESLPERRTGTPWQRNPWLGGFASCAWRMLVDPTATFRAARAQRIAHGTLLFISWSLTCMLWPLAWALALVRIGIVSLAEVPYIIIIVVTPPLTLCFGSLLILGRIWIRAAQAARRWRPGWTHARVISDHATMMLCAGPLLALPLAAAVSWADVVTATGISRPMFQIYLTAAVVLHPLAPVVLYMHACGRGMRAMRFANPPRETAP